MWDSFMFEKVSIAALFVAFVCVSQVFAMKPGEDPTTSSVSNGPSAKRRKVTETPSLSIVTRSMSRRMVAPQAGERNNTSEIPVVTVVPPPVINPVPDQLCIFEGVKLTPDSYELLYDVLDLRSFLSLGSTSKSVRAKITHHITQRDPRKLHLIRWQDGPIPRHFEGNKWTGAHVNSLWFNYLLNKSVYTLQKYTFVSWKSNAISPSFDRAIANFDVNGGRLGPLGLDIQRVFRACRGILNWYSVDANSLPFYGKDATATPGHNRAERNMAHFMAFLSSESNRGFTDPSLFMKLVGPGLYYDAPLSPEKRSTVERYLKSKTILEGLDPYIATTASVDAHLERAKLWAQLFEEEVSFTPNSLLKFTGAINDARQPISPDLAAVFYKAVVTHQEVVITRWTPKQRWNLCDALKKICKIDKSHVGYLLLAREIMEEVLRIQGDATRVKDIKSCAHALCDIWEEVETWPEYLVRASSLFERVLLILGDNVTDTALNHCAWSYRELWRSDKTKRHHLTRALELYDRELALMGAKATAYDLEIVAEALRGIWQADSTQTDLLVRAVGLVERRHNLLVKKGNLKRSDVILKAWHYLQHSRVDSKMTGRRQVAKTLWAQSLKMNEDIVFWDVEGFLKELNQEFASASAEVKGTEKS